MVAHAVAELPNECCGLLAGDIKQKADEAPVGTVRRRFALINMEQSPREFVSDPHSMFDAVRQIDSEGLAILAVYHSHPTSDPIPSCTDLERNYSPDVMNLIISLKGEMPFVRGWWLKDSTYEAAAWRLLEQ